MEKKLGDLKKEYPENMGAGELRYVPSRASKEIHKRML